MRDETVAVRPSRQAVQSSAPITFSPSCFLLYFFDYVDGIDRDLPFSRTSRKNGGYGYVSGLLYRSTTGPSWRSRFLFRSLWTAGAGKKPLLSWPSDLAVWRTAVAPRPRSFPQPLDDPLRHRYWRSRARAAGRQRLRSLSAGKTLPHDGVGICRIPLGIAVGIAVGWICRQHWGCGMPLAAGGFPGAIAAFLFFFRQRLIRPWIW